MASEGKNAKLTPMMKQYLAIKAEHEGCLLFFRLGDFYELFFDDAVETAKLLGLTLTGRGKGETRVPMCGVPHHAAEGYIAKLTKLGKKVAMCDQVSDPSEPGIVQREVVRIVTPGTTLDEKVLDAKRSNYVAAVMKAGASAGDDARGFALAFADVTTGEFGTVSVRDEKSLGAELQRLGPSELVVRVAELESGWVEGLKRMRGAFVFGHASEATDVAEFLMDYLKETQKTNLDHMVVGDGEDGGAEQFMALDEATLKNLELMETLREGKKEGSLLWVIDKTETAMGGRLLRYFLTHPLVDVNAVAQRLDAVEELVGERALAEDLRGVLGSILDMERLLARLSMNRGSARDVAALKQSLQQIPAIQQLLSSSADGQGAKTELLAGIRDGIDPLSDIVALIEKAIVEEPPLTFNDGGVIADGYHQELDELKAISREGKSYIQKMQQEEIARTGISNLKVRYNKVFGYYLEVSKSHVNKVPETWIRKQTLVNAERYITPELKEYEEKVLGAEEKIVALEQQLFAEIRAKVVAEKDRIQKTAKKLALLDVLQSFAAAALMNRYCKPTISTDGSLNIVNGRHPVVEEMSFAARFVPNDTHLLHSEERVQLITGPNMGGKSTYLRQVALIVLMAQIGCFVPAEAAEIGMVDRIFTRVGASDNLVRGQSTFMVEMQETADILASATEKSLVILDEIGRGTSTYDGMSIAWSILEYLHDHVGAKTLFATHYHELIALADKLEHAVNYSVAVKENAEEGVVFLYKVLKGGVDKSYGIEVAKLAGLPANVIARAGQILQDLEEGSHEQAVQKELDSRPAQTQSMLFQDDRERDHNPLQKEIDAIDTDNMTPMEALQKLTSLKKRD